MRALLIPIAAFALLGACSRQPQPMVDAVKPMQESVEKARAVEQTLQQSHEARQKAAGE